MRQVKNQLLSERRAHAAARGRLQQELETQQAIAHRLYHYLKLQSLLGGLVGGRWERLCELPAIFAPGGSPISRAGSSLGGRSARARRRRAAPWSGTAAAGAAACAPAACRSGASRRATPGPRPGGRWRSSSASPVCRRDASTASGGWRASGLGGTGPCRRRAAGRRLRSWPRGRRCRPSARRLRSGAVRGGGPASERP